MEKKCPTDTDAATSAIATSLGASPAALRMEVVCMAMELLQQLLASLEDMLRAEFADGGEEDARASSSDSDEPEEECIAPRD